VKRLLLNAAVALSLLAAACFTWVWGRHARGESSFLGIGRSCHTLDIDADPTRIRFRFCRYHAPPFGRTEPFWRTTGNGGRFVDNYDISGYELGDFSMTVERADYEMRPVRFFTMWGVSFPYWAALLVTFALPGVRFAEPFLRRRKEPAGFPCGDGTP